jgi:hypothetical protein
LRGFNEVGRACVRLKVPENAYLDASGNDWTCNRGYLKSDRGCTAAIVPAHAHLDDISEMTGHANAAPLVVPIGGYIDFSNHDWTCEEGFHKQRRKAISIVNGAVACYDDLDR